MVRHAALFANKWIEYYSRQLGEENVYLFIDGFDLELPANALRINYMQEAHIAYPRVKGDRRRAHKISAFARSLFDRYDVVMAMDIDEFVILDPSIDATLREYLQLDFNCLSVSAMGVDVGQHPDLEAPLIWEQPWLSQRQFASISDRYTKPVIAFEPLTWGSGFHRVKGKDYTIDPNIFLFHFGLVDYQVTLDRIKNENNHWGWSFHNKRRLQLFKKIQANTPQEGDNFMRKAKHKLVKNRSWWAPNKPAPLRGNTIIQIPERFRKVL